MGYIQFHETGTVSGAGPLNSTSPCMLSIKNKGPETAYIGTAANSSPSNENAYPLAAGESLLIPVKSGEQYFYGSYAIGTTLHVWEG